MEGRPKGRIVSRRACRQIIRQEGRKEGRHEVVGVGRLRDRWTVMSLAGRTLQQEA